MKYASKLFVTITALLLLGAKHSMAQEQERKDSIKIEFNEDAPMLSARETPKRYYIRKVNVSGIKNLNENLVRATSGLIPGDSIYLPSSFVGNSITRLWGQRYFSDVKVGATIDGDSVDLELMLKERPRVYNWNIVGEGIGRSVTTCWRSWLCAATPSSRTTLSTVRSACSRRSTPKRVTATWRLTPASRTIRLSTTL